jgi:hypothetical protein
MPNIQLFLQSEGNRRIELVQIDAEAPVRDLLAFANLPRSSEETSVGAIVFGQHSESPLDLDITIRAAGVDDKHRIHVHRCHKIEVTVHFNEVTEKFHFPPSATVDRVKRHFVDKIHMSPVDATEHVLQLCGSSDRPEPDNQIGALVSCACSLCFDLVPIKRVEG